MSMHWLAAWEEGDAYGVAALGSRAPYLLLCLLLVSGCLQQLSKVFSYHLLT